jgi:hypothetical protein
MIQLKSREQMKRAIERARQLKPFVRVRGFRWYEVRSSDGKVIYTIHFYKQGGQRFGECNCKAGEKGLICYHLAGAVAVHIGLAAMRQGAKD